MSSGPSPHSRGRGARATLAPRDRRTAISIDPWFVSFFVALGIGLLIGTERERRKGDKVNRAAAGLRTFTLVSLSGLVSATVGGVILLSVTLLATTALAVLSSMAAQEHDPDLTTEVALVLTVLLGGLSLDHPVLGGAAAVATATLLAARTRLHHFVSQTLTQTELRDGLVLAAATFIVLPLLPDHPIDPFGAVNPRSVWTVAVLVMAVGAIGHIATRALGARYGLPIAGLAAGFVSSTATIGAMGSRVRARPDLLHPATMAAILSTVATVVQLAAVLGATSVATVLAYGPSLALAGLTAIAYSAGFGLRRKPAADETAEPERGHAFSVASAIGFAAMLTTVLIATSVVGAQFGAAGLAVTAGLAGFVDVHSVSVAIATQVATGQIGAKEAVLPLLVAFSTNSVSKAVFALVGGGFPFAVRLVPGLVLVAACGWLGTLIPTGL